MSDDVKEANICEMILQHVGKSVDKDDFQNRMDELSFSAQESSLIWNLISVNLENTNFEDNDVEFKNALEIFNLK